VKDASARFLQKAERGIAGAERVVDFDAEAATSRAYYSMFYCAEALLNERGLRFRKHGGVHAAFGEHCVKTGSIDQKFHQWLLQGFNKRISADYGIEVQVTTDEAREMIAQAREFLLESRRLLETSLEA
jgi:uncharacterized protein (UPF0332 family)